MKKGIGLVLMLAALLCVCGSCRKGVENFSFSYSMESVNNYKVSVSFQSDKTYRIEEINFFMDNHANRRAPVIREGVMTDSEYNELAKLLSASDLFGMADSYGFEKEYDRDLGDIMYQLDFTSGGREKFISIRNSERQLFSAPFLQLLKYLSAFIGSHREA